MAYANEPLISRIVRQFFLTRLEILFIIMVNVVLIAGVIAVLIVESSVDVDLLSQYVKSDTVVNFSNSIITADVATIILWSIVGSLVYLLLISVGSFFSDTNSIFNTAFTYVRPPGFSRQKYLTTVIVERIVSMIFVFLSLIYFVVLIRLIVPYVYFELKSMFLHIGFRSVGVLLHLFLFSLAIHVLVVLFRMEAQRYKPDNL